MVNRVYSFVRTYPVTLWATTGVLAYVWKASMTATIYQKHFKNYEESRLKEL